MSFRNVLNTALLYSSFGLASLTPLVSLADDSDVLAPPPDLSEAPPEQAPPVVESSPGSGGTENVSEMKMRDPRIPLFQNIRPEWGVELSGAIKGLGGTILEGQTANAISIQMEWQPDFIQDLGVVSVGPSLSVYPIFDNNRPTSSPLSIWSVGGQVRYQGRFFREQPIVPTFGYAMESVAYRFAQGSGNSGRIMIQGPVLGGMLYLNLFEPSSAAEFYVTQGVLRSYLVAELRLMTGSDTNLTVDGKSLYLGLRFEF